MKTLGYIYLIDDDEAIRDSLTLTLTDMGYEVFSFSKASLFLDAFPIESPAVILLDMQMPEMSGLELQEKLLQKGKTTPIIFISGQSHQKQIIDVFRNGAKDFILKPFSDQQLLSPIKLAIEADRQSQNSLDEKNRIQNLYALLTPKEKEVCDLLVKVPLSKEVAQILNISESTVKIHKSRVMQKMAVTSLQHLTANYLEARLGSFISKDLTSHISFKSDWRKKLESIADNDSINAELVKEMLSHSEFQFLSTITALAKARDNETGNHIVRTQHYVNLLAIRLRKNGRYLHELSDSFVKSLVKAAPLHDIGKVGIPDKILLKKGSLTETEWTIMKTHTLIGESILQSGDIENDDAQSDVITKAIKIAGGHHEKWDGTGYPRGLAGESIPLEARIMMLADVYDALVSKRVYKKAWTHEDAVEEIKREKGTRFDPLIVDAFIDELETFRAIALTYGDQ
ncbi:HD domain-containing phosphohydrolase [Polynucleobacter rarus]|uniref:HD domain-containing phosphohydrolase n=1 Tax=Polynucleobacter rarus TaxID=556055 RepID=UPI000D3E50BA|nr:HD domain-containing phosphohydrolase [Polynucleobacter rarus]